jgi:hypothetical protein
MLRGNLKCAHITAAPGRQARTGCRGIQRYRSLCAGKVSILPMNKGVSQPRRFCSCTVTDMKLLVTGLAGTMATPDLTHDITGYTCKTGKKSVIVVPQYGDPCPGALKLHPANRFPPAGRRPHPGLCVCVHHPARLFPPASGSGNRRARRPV